MIVLSREKGEQIVVNDQVFITVEEADAFEVTLVLTGMPRGMLAFTRQDANAGRLPEKAANRFLLQKNEWIVIGDDVSICIVDLRLVDGDRCKVRLGVLSPSHMPVHRREVYDAIQRHAGPPPS